MLAAGRICIVKRQGNIIDVQSFAIVLNQRPRHPPRPLTDVIVDDLLAPEFEVPFETGPSRKRDRDRGEFEPPQYAQFKSKPAAVAG